MRLPVRAPFHLEATVRLLQRRPANLIDRWEEQRYRRAIQLRSGPVLIEVENRGTIDAPEVRLFIAGGEAPARHSAEARSIARQILGLDIDPAVLQQCAEAEPALRLTAVGLRGMRPPRFPGLFEAFANVIPFQQVSVEAGIAMVAELVRRFGNKLVLKGRSHHLFPSAEAVALARTASIRRCGMSARKSEALRLAARAIASRDLTVDELAALSSAEALARLMQFPGIGPWSAALILLRGLRRLDVFPPADVGAESALAALLRLRSRRSLAGIVERFGDYRGYLYFYGLASRLLAAGLIHPAIA